MFSLGSMFNFIWNLIQINPFFSWEFLVKWYQDFYMLSIGLQLAHQWGDDRPRFVTQKKSALGRVLTATLLCIFMSGSHTTVGKLKIWHVCHCALCDQVGSHCGWTLFLAICTIVHVLEPLSVHTRSDCEKMNWTKCEKWIGQNASVVSILWFCRI